MFNSWSYETTDLSFKRLRLTNQRSYNENETYNFFFLSLIVIIFLNAKTIATNFIFF